MKSDTFSMKLDIRSVALFLFLLALPAAAQTFTAAGPHWVPASEVAGAQCSAAPGTVIGVISPPGTYTLSGNTQGLVIDSTGYTVVVGPSGITPAACGSTQWITVNPVVASGWTLKAHTAAGAATTPAIDTTGADLLVVCGTTFNGAGTISDSKGNTWHTATSDSGGFATQVMGYVEAGTVGTGHTFSLSGGAPSLAVLAYNGSVNPPLDASSHASATAATLQAGAVTPTAANELVVACAGADATVSSIDSGFTLQDSVPFNSGVAEAQASATFVQSVAGAVNPTWTLSASTAASALIATFK